MWWGAGAWGFRAVAAFSGSDVGPPKLAALLFIF